MSATSTSGTPQSTRPAPNEVASLPRAAIPAATRTARRAPTPTAPSRSPTPGVPRSSTSIASTTTSTLNMPATNVCTENNPITTRSSGSARMHRQPARRPRPPSTSGSADGAPATPRRRARTTATPTRPAETPNTVAILVPASRTAPSAGPRNKPTLSTPLARTFAAVSSSGVETSAGVMAA
jgi:hypothetical protein